MLHIMQEIKYSMAVDGVVIVEDVVTPSPDGSGVDCQVTVNMQDLAIDQVYAMLLSLAIHYGDSWHQNGFTVGFWEDVHFMIDDAITEFLARVDAEKGKSDGKFAQDFGDGTISN